MDIRGRQRECIEALPAGLLERPLPRGQFDKPALTMGRRMYVPPTNLRVFAEAASACRGARNDAWQLQTAPAMLRLAESFPFLTLAAIARRPGADAA